MSNGDRSGRIPTTTPLGLEPYASGSSAPTWESGLIAGSGRVGGLLFGAPGALTVSFSHERFLLPATAEFITGVRDPNNDGDWQAYLDGMEGLGVDRYVEIWQNAYDGR